MLAAGLVDEVRMDVVPVMFGPASRNTAAGVPGWRGPRGGHLGNWPPVPQQQCRVLVVVGDSLTHGMSSAGGVPHRPLLAALVAAGLGLNEFAVPTYGGPLRGLPLNIEELLRQLQERFGDDLNLSGGPHPPPRPARDRRPERGLLGTRRRVRTAAYGPQVRNLGIYGWDVRDALSYTAARASMRASVRVRDDFLGARPDHDNDIAAAFRAGAVRCRATQFRAATWHGRDGGIDTLVVALGANNALRSVVDKSVVWSGEASPTWNARAPTTCGVLRTSRSSTPSW